MKKETKKYIIIGSIVLAVIILAVIFSINRTVVNENIQDAKLGLVNLKISTVSWLSSIFNRQESLFSQTTGSVGDNVVLHSSFQIAVGSKPVDQLKIDIYKDGNLFTTLNKNFNPAIQPSTLLPPYTGWLNSAISWQVSAAGTYTSKTYIRCTNSFLSCSGTWSLVNDDVNTLVVREACSSHDHKNCVGNDLYWYNSCGNQEGLIETCQNGCSNNACNSPPQPTCSDNIQNQGETGVDCGGPCLACYVAPTCSDGIQNQGELGIDCGGPCNACINPPTCYDGIQNGAETGVDCGGSCQACGLTPTCSDGIKNQDETDIDCGGSKCPACKKPTPFPWLIIVAILIVLSLAGYATYLFIKRKARR